MLNVSLASIEGLKRQSGVVGNRQRVVKVSVCSSPKVGKRKAPEAEGEFGEGNEGVRICESESQKRNRGSYQISRGSTE